MFDAMIRLVTEQQLRDGAMQHKEFETLPRPAVGLNDQTRAELVAFLLSEIPERHQFVSATGRKGIVYFDQRGRASSQVIDDIDDEDLAWIAGSLKGSGSMSPSASHGYLRPAMAEGDRSSVEKQVFSKFPTDSKRKPNLVMLTGDVAEAAGVKDYTRVKLSDLTDAQLNAIAKAVGVKGMSEERSAIDRYNAGEPVLYADLKREGWGSKALDNRSPRDRVADLLRRDEAAVPPDVARTMATAKENEKRYGHLATFKKGEFWKSKSQGLWFWPTEDLKNGGVKGLQLDLSFSTKPKWKTVNANEKPRARNEFWVVAKPDDEILVYFRKHDEFTESVMHENIVMRSPTDEEVAELRKFVRKTVPGNVSVKAYKSAKGSTVSIQLPPGSAAGGEHFVQVAQWLVARDWVQWPGGDQEYLIKQQDAALKYDSFYHISNLMKKA